MEGGGDGTTSKGNSTAQKTKKREERIHTAFETPFGKPEPAVNPESLLFTPG
jgi:hypothetical protein